MFAKVGAVLAPAWGHTISVEDGVFRLDGQRLLDGDALELRLPGRWVEAVWRERPPRVLLHCGGHADRGRESGPAPALEPFDGLCLRHAAAAVPRRRG
jgi:hypothetical protein